MIRPSSQTFIRHICVSRRLYTPPTKDWFASEIISDRKSYFQARHTALYDSGDVAAVLDEFLAQHKSISKSASHPHMIAWRTGTPCETTEPESTSKSKSKSSKKSSKGTKESSKPKGSKETSKSKSSKDDHPSHAIKYINVQQGFKDNGEKGAGAKIMEVIQHHNLMNILIIATRWYSGIPIGSSRFRHIVNTSYDSLRKGNRL